MTRFLARNNFISNHLRAAIVSAFSYVVTRFDLGYVSRWRVRSLLFNILMQWIFRSERLCKFFRVRETPLSSFDFMETLTIDGILFRMRFFGFVNACQDWTGDYYNFSLNTGRTVSEIKRSFRRRNWSLYDYREEANLRNSRR